MLRYVSTPQITDNFQVNIQHNRIAGNSGHWRAQSHRTRTLPGRDKKGYVMSFAEEVEGHFNVKDL